ncbi:MAG: cytochrome c biogenesis protein ResB [Chlamydiota bacterium]|nr:cytochrome c biogenesis protein ResB [Chlamydiota bacterium]
MIQPIVSFIRSYIFAIILMLILGIASIFGTIYESSFSTEAAQQLIYKTWWFTALLALIFINVLFSTFKRWPFQKYHFGFLVTHLGLLVLLLGAMVSKTIGIEGNMAIQEGETGSSFATRIESLQIAMHGVQDKQIFEKRFTNRVNQHPWIKSVSGADIEIAVDGYFHNSILQDQYVEVKNGGRPAVHIKLENAMAHVNEWLVLDHPEKSALDFGVASVHFMELKSAEDISALMSEEAVETKKTKGSLKISISDKQDGFEFSVDQYLGKTVPISDSDYQIHIKDFYSHAIVSEGKLINKSEAYINPAVEFEIIGPHGSERHFAFSRYPDFDSMHQKDASAYPIHSHFICDSSAGTGNGNSISVYWGPEQKLFYKIQTANASSKSGEFKVGDTINTGWMGLTLSIDQALANAVQQYRVVNAEPDRNGENTPAIRVRIRDKSGKESDPTWIQKGMHRIVHVDERHYDVAYRYLNVPLGFSLKLLDFNIGYYPGSRQPKHYESVVELDDPEQGIKETRQIYMNHTLVHRGYKFFQSSYIEGSSESQPDITVLSVNRDPGTLLIYVGSIILVLGIFLLFFTRYSGKREVL